jgi:hypothetical protein
MGKRNKITYTATPKKRVDIALTGNVYLQYRDDERVEKTHKGDLLVYAECKQLHTNYLGEYERTGFTGYFKVDVFDGSEWRAVLLNDIFPSNEHHFSRTERSIDTYHLIYDMLTALARKPLTRTYREHYMLAVDEATDDEAIS